MKNKLLLCFLILFSLTSCSSTSSSSSSSSVENKYSNIVPYIEVERNEEKTFKEIDVDEYVTKVTNKDSFIMYFYMSTCSHCASAKKELLIPYMEETSTMIYAMDIRSEVNYSKLILMKDYQILDDQYYRVKEDNTVGMSTPTICIVREGMTIAYEKGYSENLLNIIKAYCYLTTTSE